MKRAPWTIAGLAVLIGGTACADADRSRPGDDASMNEVATVLASSSPEEVLISTKDTPMETWSVDDSASLTIGGGGSEPGGVLNRVVAALVLGDGRIMVADGAQRVMFYSRDGQYIGHFGGPGGGPGEFERIISIQRVEGDSLLVAERLGRLTVFSSYGELVRTVRVILPPVPRFLGAFADGSLVGVLTRGQQVSGTPLLQYEVEVARYDPNGTFLNSLVTVCCGEMVRVPGMPAIGTELLHQPSVTVGPAEVYVAPGHRLEVLVFDPDGNQIRVLQEEFDPIRLTVDAFIEPLPATLQRQIESQLDGWPRDQTIPATQVIRLDDSGNLWMQEFQTDAETPSTWLVFAPSGQRIAAASMPARFRPTHIGDDFVIGVWRDDFDVEYVQLRGIMKRRNP